jgi:hypothetical protein
MKQAFINKVEQYLAANNIEDKELLEKAKLITSLSEDDQLTEEYADMFIDNHDIWEAIQPFEVVLADNWAKELLEASTSEIRDQITAEIASLISNVPAEHLLILTEDIIKGNAVIIRDYLVMLLAGSDALDVIEQSKITLLESLKGMVDIYREHIAK